MSNSSSKSMMKKSVGVKRGAATSKLGEELYGEGDLGDLWREFVVAINFHVAIAFHGITVVFRRCVWVLNATHGVIIRI